MAQLEQFQITSSYDFNLGIISELSWKKKLGALIFSVIFTVCEEENKEMIGHSSVQCGGWHLCASKHS